MRSGESGNIFFYIFLGVILFGALSYAVSQSGRGSVESIAREQARLRATEIIDFSDAVSKAVGTMRLRGVSLAQLRFAHSALSISDYGNSTTIDPVNLVFNPAGGEVIYRDPTADMLVSPGGQWMFVTGNQVAGFGTDCATADCSDLLMVLGHLRGDICQAVNALAGIKNPASMPEVAELNTGGKFQGTLADAPKTIGTASSLILAAQSFGCFKNNDDNRHYFYRVLWAQ